ncbi:deoxyribonuclease IV [Micromonospora sp. WP24]|uniref:deoxyribonuclease IV n=1 Tax=Micromonospora sp. WP24 TaxID=2604469 RepID=UPI0011D8F82F|nr:deoxyribonuclease IV [Micromonospora sp. WP24]TYC02165.1 deoxyribonuclease IV [Micromonospora sp. WP24]
MSGAAGCPSGPVGRSRPAIGSHVAVGGGLVRVGLREAEDVEAEVIQIFASNPRAWRPSPVDPRIDAQFRERCAELSVPVFVHASHLINLGSPSDSTRESSVALLGHTLRRAADLGARGVVVHAGTSVSRGRRAAALAVLHGLVGRLLDEAPEQVRLLIEPTAGGGEALAATVDSTIEYFSALNDDRVGICLDTCHLHAAGEAMTTAAEVQRTVSKVAAAIGGDRVGLIHVNDSRDASGSLRDRHESLGAGQIGANAFDGLFLAPELAGVPMVVETPSHRADVAFLKSRRAQALAPHDAAGFCVTGSR